MNHQTSDPAEGNPLVDEVENSSNHAATTTAAPRTSESARPLLSPVTESIQNVAQNRNESSRQKDRNNEPSALHHARDVNVKDISPSGLPSSVIEENVTTPIHSMTNQTTFCPVRQAVFSNPKDLKVHEKAAHTEPPTARGYDDDITCDICYKTFKHASSLELHKHNVHNGTPVAFCDKCPANFTSTRNLVFHKWDHHCQPQLVGPVRRKRRKPHQCAHCGFKSRKKILVKQHEKAFHGDVNPPKFPCTYDCGYLGDSEAGRQSHELYCRKAPKRD